MRSALLGLGLLTAAGLFITTVVHGQVNQNTDASSDRYASWGTSGAGSNGVLLADASDPFSVARKTQDMNFGAANSSSSSSANSTANTTAPLFNAGAASGQPDSTTGNSGVGASDAKQSAGRTSIQSIFPGATASTTQNSTANKTHSTTDNSSDATTSGPLKGLQQRLSAVRKPPAPAAATITDVHPPVVEIPKTSTAPAVSVPSIAGPVVGGPVVGGPVVVGPVPSQMRPKVATISESPLPPAMPDVHSTNLSANVDEFAPGSSTTFKPGDPLVSVAVTPTAPAISESANVGRHSHFSLQPASASQNTITDLDASPGQESVAHEPTPARSIPISNDNVLFSQQNPILGVQTIGPRSISVGKEATYCIVIANSGEMAAQNVTVSVKTPEWSEILGTKVSTGEAVATSEQRGEPLVWRLPRLESHSKEQFVIRLVPRESRAFDLGVEWACAPAVSQAMVEVKEPKIAMVLDGPSEILYGQSKIYKLTLSNPGTGDAENVELLLAPVDGGPGAPTRQEIGLIRAGESRPVEVELSARQAGKLSVKAVAIADGSLRAEVAEDVLVRRAGLKATVNGPEVKFAGTPASYNVVIGNPGNATSENISIAAVLPPGAKYVSSPGGQFVEAENKVVWNLPSLRAGAEQELQFSCVLSTPGTNRLQVLTTAANDLYDNTATATNVEALADLKLEVSDPPGPLAVGEEMTYDVHVRNRGSKAAENVDVAAFFSNGIEPTNAQGAPHEITAGQVVFQAIPLISAGSEVVLKITARADQPGNHVFRAEVKCSSMGAKLASEETTLFYGDGATPAEQHVAARPTNPTNAGPQSVPPSGSAGSGVTR